MMGGGALPMVPPSPEDERLSSEVIDNGRLQHLTALIPNYTPLLPPIYTPIHRYTPSAHTRLYTLLYLSIHFYTPIESYIAYIQGKQWK